MLLTLYAILKFIGPEYLNLFIGWYFAFVCLKASDWWAYSDRVSGGHAVSLEGARPDVQRAASISGADIRSPDVHSPATQDLGLWDVALIQGVEAAVASRG